MLFPFASSSDTEDSESTKSLKAALSIKINGGEFDLNSSDDGFNVAGGNDEMVRQDPFLYSKK